NISGTISGYRLMSLNNVNALKNATLNLAPNATLRLRSDTNGATFLTAGLTQTNNSTSMTINVDVLGAGTGNILKLGGNYSRSAGSGSATINATGANGYSLELTGNLTNTTANPVIVNANSANVVLSGTSVAIGTGGLQLGGALATGVNTVSGVISG